MTCIFYAWSTLNLVLLAFNLPEYSPTFFFFNRTVWYLCLPFGMLTIVVSQQAKLPKKYFAALVVPFTYKDVVVQFGYVGFLLMILEWLYFALKYNYKEWGTRVYSDFYFYSVFVSESASYA